MANIRVVKNIKNGQLHRHYQKCKDYIALKEDNKARDYCDMGIGYVASKRENGYKAKDLIENVRVELWLERFWMYLENNKLML